VRDEQQIQTTDDPSGPGWRDVGPDELLQTGDMYPIGERWEPTHGVGLQSRMCRDGYRRRIEPQQPSDSEPETMEDLRRRLADAEVEAMVAERGGQQVQSEMQKLREQLYEAQRTSQRYRNQLEGALEHAPKRPRNFRERMVLEKYRAFVEAKDDDPLTFGYVQLRATDPHVLGCSEFVVESWHQDVGGGRLSESVRVFLRHYASEEDQESRKEISARTYFHVKTVGDYERLLSLLGIGGNESGH